MTTLHCPECRRELHKKFPGRGWKVIPRHTRPDSEKECRGGDIRRQGKLTLLAKIERLEAEVERRKRFEIELAERIYLAFEVLSRLAEKRTK